VLLPRIALGREAKIAINAAILAVGVVASVVLKPWVHIRSFKRDLLQRVRDPQWTFYAIDLDRDGYLDYQDVRQAALSVLGHKSSVASLEEVFREIDKDDDGYVSLAEFERWWATTDEYEGFRRKLSRVLDQDVDHRERARSFGDQPSQRTSRWKTVRIQNGRDIRLVWENRRLLLQHNRSSV